MKKQKANRTSHIPRIRLTVAERKKIMQEYEKTFHFSLASYVREKLLDNTVTSFYKKKIETLRELGQFRTDLSRIGNNINQIAKTLNTYKQGALHKGEIEVLKRLLQLLEKIFATLNKIRI